VSWGESTYHQYCHHPLRRPSVHRLSIGQNRIPIKPSPGVYFWDLPPVFHMYPPYISLYPWYPAVSLYRSVSSHFAPDPLYPAVSHCIQLYPYVSSCI